MTSERVIDMTSETMIDFVGIPIEEKRELQRQIDALLAKPSLTPSERKQCDLLMSKAANLRSDEERRARAAAVLAEVGADLPLNGEERFRRYVRGEISLRTYSPEDITTGGVLIPQKWTGTYAERLKAFVGIREAGANVISTANGDTLKYPFSDDSQNDGQRLDENTAMPLANPTFSINTLGAFNYVSKGVQISNQLLTDSDFDINGYLQNIFAKRVGRISNSEFTLGAVGGPVGVIPSITGIQTSAAPTAVTVAELIGLQSLDAAYLPGAVYMFSPGVERTLKAMVTADGLPIFPEMRTGKVLLGFPYVLNVSMPALQASAKAVVFGNFKLGVTIRDTVPVFFVKTDKYADQYLTYFSLVHRQDCMVTDPNALAVLQQHA